MKNEQVLEVVNKLIGEISPVGDSNHDEDCLNNLIEYNELLFQMYQQLIPLTYHKHSFACSVKKIGEEADNALYNVYRNLKDMYEGEDE